MLAEIVLLLVIGATGCDPPRSPVGTGGVGGTSSGNGGSGAGNGGSGNAVAGSNGGAGSGGGCLTCDGQYSAIPTPLSVELDANSGSCAFRINTPCDVLVNTAWINVLMDGMLVNRDVSHTNGWDFTDVNNKTFQVYGSTCDAIQAGALRTVCVRFEFVTAYRM